MRRETVVNECDIDGQPAVMSHTYREGKHERTIDLCKKHAAPLQKLLDQLPAQPRRTGRRARVVTLEDIERSKSVN